MAEEGSRDTGWAPVIADRLLPEHVDGLLSQKIPYVLIPGFLSTDWCAEIVNRFKTFIAEHPDKQIRLQPNARTNVAVDAVALPMNLFVQSKPARLEEYFSLVSRDQPNVRRLFEGGKDPYQAISSFLQAAEWKVLPAVEGDQPYLTDIVWGTTGQMAAPTHVDSYHLETQCSLTRFKHRFSFNTFIQRPETGGNFRVYRWRKKDGDFGDRGRQVWAEYAVRAGDLLFFDAGNFHEVKEMSGPVHRLFSHMAVGLDPASHECSIFI